MALATFDMSIFTSVRCLWAAQTLQRCNTSNTAKCRSQSLQLRQQSAKKGILRGLLTIRLRALLWGVCRQNSRSSSPHSLGIRSRPTISMARGQRQESGQSRMAPNPVRTRPDLDDMLTSLKQALRTYYHLASKRGLNECRCRY